MLTMVTARNARKGILELPLMDSSGGFVVKEIEGLGPVKAVLTSSALAQMDGAQMHNARREPRNLLVKIGIEPDYSINTVAGLRSVLYGYFMPKAPVSLGFYIDDVLFATSEATVESADPSIFTPDPGMDISLICWDPDYYAPEPVHIDGMTVDDTTTQTITYEGSSDTGVTFEFTFPETASEITIYNTRPDDIINIMRITGSFLVNDVLKMNTNPGQKSLTLTRAGLEASLVYGLDETSWVSLAPGDNLFRAYYPGTSAAFELEYTARYGGL